MINITYDPKSNSCNAVKNLIGDTISYLGVAKICPKCNDYIRGYPALSRKDNKTEICSRCAILEAVEMYKTK